MAGFSLTFSSSVGFVLMGNTFEKQSGGLPDCSPCLEEKVVLKGPECAFWKGEGFCLWLIGLRKAKIL